MTSSRTSLAYARQSRVRVRSSVGLAAIFFGAGVVALVFGVMLPWLFGGGAFFLVIAGVELFNARYNERRAREKTAMMDESRFGPFEIRGEYRGFGAVIDWVGKRVYVDIVQDARVRERAAAALAVVDGFAEFLDTFCRFKASEAARRSEVADAILALELELVAFIAKKDPAFAEVSFTEASGGDLWICSFKDGRFFDLAEEP